MPLPDSKVQGAKMRRTWGQQDPGGSHIGHMNLAILELMKAQQRTAVMIALLLDWTSCS